MGKKFARSRLDEEVVTRAKQLWIGNYKILANVAQFTSNEMNGQGRGQVIQRQENRKWITEVQNRNEWKRI